MATKYAVIRLDRVSATKDPGMIKSVKLSKELQNGSVVEIKDLVDGEREVYTTATPAADTKYFGILCTPELMYDEKKTIQEFVNGTDKPARVILVKSGDYFSLTEEAFSTKPTKGQAVELQASEVLKVADAATSGSTQVGTIADIETINGITFYGVEVR